MNEKPLIEADDLLSGQLSNLNQFGKRVQLTNMVLDAVGPFRVHECAPINDGLCISALAVAAGAIYGEIVELGIVADMTDEAVTKLMVFNFRAGQEMGRNKAQRARAAHAADAAAINGL